MSDIINKETGEVKPIGRRQRNRESSYRVNTVPDGIYVPRHSSKIDETKFSKLLGNYSLRANFSHPLGEVKPENIVAEVSYTQPNHVKYVKTKPTEFDLDMDELLEGVESVPDRNSDEPTTINPSLEKVESTLVKQNKTFNEMKEARLSNGLEYEDPYLPTMMEYGSESTSYIAPSYTNYVFKDTPNLFKDARSIKQIRQNHYDRKRLAINDYHQEAQENRERGGDRLPALSGEGFERLTLRAFVDKFYPNGYFPNEKVRKQIMKIRDMSNQSITNAVNTFIQNTNSTHTSENWLDLLYRHLSECNPSFLGYVDCNNYELDHFNVLEEAREIKLNDIESKREEEYQRKHADKLYGKE